RRSNPAVPSQSCHASSFESFIPILRCSGESTKNNPPNDHHACPPRDASGSWSNNKTFLFEAAISVVVTSPARPAPTTIASYSIFLLLVSVYFYLDFYLTIILSEFL